jgi:hypothetical protein
MVTGMISPALTPRLLVIAARIALLPCAGVFVAAVMADCSAASAAGVAFGCALVLLQAAPRLRASDLLGVLALGVTLVEWVHAGFAGGIDIARWEAAIAVPGALVLLLKVQHLRGLARHDAYVPLRQLERRQVLFARRPARTDDAVTQRIA